MRIWLDPVKLAAFSLMPSDVQTAIESQNTQVSSGQLGATPSNNAQQLVATVRSRSRLQTPEQFRNIVIKSKADGSAVRLSDVARVEMGDGIIVLTSSQTATPLQGLRFSWHRALMRFRRLKKSKRQWLNF